MERVEGLLFHASLEGNVTLLQTLLQEDPLILDRVSVNRCDNMPLHVASMLGHIDFVNEILSRKPQLATESDSQRCLPLHIASAKGHAEIVKALLSAHPETCLARDRDGRNPIHLAAIKGRYEVVKELLQAQPHAARAMVEQETILHLCVKHNQLEVLKLLVERMVDHEFVNSKDGDGNNILHLAVADKQIETINFLLLNTTIEVNASNTNGETSMDILAQGPKDVKDHQIIQSLLRANAVEVKTEDPSGEVRHQNGRISKKGSKYFNKLLYSEKKKKWLEEARNALMIVAILIATVAFQAGTNPPGGVWQQDEDAALTANSNHTAALTENLTHTTILTANSTNTAPFKDPPPPAYKAGCAVMATKDKTAYEIFLISNSLGFVSSLSIILLLISGFPLMKFRVFTWILMLVMWVAAASMSVTYFVALAVLTPRTESKVFKYVAQGILIAWVGLISLVVIGHILDGLVRLMKKLLKCISVVSKGLRRVA